MRLDPRVTPALAALMLGGCTLGALTRSVTSESEPGDEPAGDLTIATSGEVQAELEPCG